MKRLAMLALVVVMLFSVMAPAVLAADSNPIPAAAEKYFSGGTKNMKAADLYANLNDGDKTNDPFMVDIRAAADYANGHIPGTVNIAGKDLFTADNLAKLPKDKPIVLNCYSGQTASQITAALRMMGYDAYNLLYAAPSWGTNEKVTYPFKADQSGNYKFSTDAAPLEGAFTAPKPLGDTPEAAAQAYFPGGFKALKAADLFANLNDGDTGNDPVILDARSAKIMPRATFRAPLTSMSKRCSRPRTWPSCLPTSRSSPTATPVRPPARSPARCACWATMPTLCSLACPLGPSLRASRRAFGT